MSSLKYNIYLLVLLVTLSTACGDGSSNSEDGEGPGGDTTLVTLTAVQVAQVGIKTGPIEQRDLSKYIETNGYIDVPPQNKAEVSSFKAGYVKTTNLLVGDKVQKGQILVILENPDFIKSQQDYMEIKGQLDYLKAEYERKKVLESEKITAQRNLQKAQADYTSALARFQGLKKELQMMGINTTQLEFGNFTSTIAIRSPIGGSVTAVNATIGKFLRPQEVIVEIVNSEHLHVELEVYEKDVVKVEKGQKFWMHIPSLTDERYEGEIYLVGKALDQETRTIHVHGHVPEKPNFFPGMYVEAGIIIENKQASAIPVTAVINEQNRSYMFIEDQKQDEQVTYRKVPIETGLSSDQWVEVKPLNSLPSQARVVLSGSYYLSSALQSN